MGTRERARSVFLHGIRRTSTRPFTLASLPATLEPEQQVADFDDGGEGDERQVDESETIEDSTVGRCGSGFNCCARQSAMPANVKRRQHPRAPSPESMGRGRSELKR